MSWASVVRHGRSIRYLRARQRLPTALWTRCCSGAAPPSDDELRRGQGQTQIHFRDTPTRHPLKFGKSSAMERDPETGEYTYTNLMANRVWADEEVDKIMEKPLHHKPRKVKDWLAYATMRTLYRVFNYCTGYKPDDPPAKAVVWRLILLESIAGCPGMVAAGMRHFRSLRRLERDHGWIHTLLEEAENERMHLLTVMKMFNAGIGTRLFVMGGQYFMVPVLSLTYIFSPKTVHRFVGYLEETAVHTYTDIIDHIEKPGTQLNKEWAHLKAPPIAIAYWRMPQDAMWIDVLRQICADESHHRDVNHSFASMSRDDPNPYLEQNIKNQQEIWAGGRQLWTTLDQARPEAPAHLKRHIPKEDKPFEKRHDDRAT